MVHSLWAASLSLAVVFPSLSLAQESLSLSVPPKRSDATVSAELDPAFAGFGIEPSNLFSFTGGDTPNTFSIQLLQNLADYSGAPPHIRVGGNTQDYMIYDETFTSISWKRNVESTAQGAIAADSMIIGPGYFQALDRFPKGTWITYGLNLAYQASDYTDRIVKHAQAAVNNLKNVQLYSFEIGNEPDLYLQNQMRSGAWDGAAYSKAFLDRADSVYKQVLEPAKLPATFFEGPCTASTIGNTFEIPQLVDNGFLGDVNGNLYVGWWNQHDYFQFIGVTVEPITLDNLMNLDSTNTQFKYWEKQIKIGLSTGVPYVLREMSSVGPIGMHEVSDTFGAALWTLNFFCYVATLNVSSVQMHMTDNSNASAWQPIEIWGKKPFVRPQYYAHAAIAQIIGNGNGTTQIGSLSTSGAGGDYKGRIRAYSVYANGNIQAAVLINSKPSPSTESNKASYTFDLDLGTQSANKDVFLSYLTADGSESLTGTSWNGMTYDDVTGLASQTDNTIYKTRTDGSGKVSVQVRDTQAVVANLDWLLGSNVVEQVDGSTTAGSRRKSSAGHTLTSPRTMAVSLVAVMIGFFCFA
ncbi:glycoside hydrolase family 79 protein [Lentithecium fluviatile CBS 122367]|uniref:Glycoside hydrolase family 79 protein n=1 Tax=Lentithecium fluviatile CBS 122367 TaxID=1168545 RepID=A0A6G1IGQ4_9PLEO|nr:glycoside hydrolase family 79 protein [Lentithecium fluviatile CBS 122367]